MEKGGGREGAPGYRDKDSLVIHREEEGYGSGVGNPATNTQGFCKIDGVQVWGEGAQSVVASDSRGTVAEYHAKRDFFRSAGAAATGIWQVC